jgi:hypothetical protein
MSDFTEKSFQFELFSYWRSSASWRVRIVFALKDIPYEYKAVNLVAAHQVSKPTQYTQGMTDFGDSLHLIKESS